MLFVLARKLGGMTVKELGRRMDMDELVEWRAFFDLEAEGETRQDLASTVEQQLTLARNE